MPLVAPVTADRGSVQIIHGNDPNFAGAHIGGAIPFGASVTDAYRSLQFALVDHAPMIALRPGSDLPLVERGAKVLFRESRSLGRTPISDQTTLR